MKNKLFMLFVVMVFTILLSNILNCSYKDNNYLIIIDSMNYYEGNNQISFDSSSIDVVNDIKIGWNLSGNFDKMTSDEEKAKQTVEDFGGKDKYIEYYETNLGDPVVTQELIDEVKSKGFNAIRLCITWRDHLYYENIPKSDSYKMFFSSTDDATMNSSEALKRKMPLIEFRYAEKKDDGTFKYTDSGNVSYANQDVSVLFPSMQSWRILDNGKYYANNNYVKIMSVDDIKTIKIDEEWLERIAEVVKMITDNDMYCIINMHNDVGIGRQHGGGYGYFLPIIYTIENPNTPDGQQKVEKMETALATIWTEIANYFKDYDYKLLFEGFNEIQSERSMYVMYNDSGNNVDKLGNYSHPWISATNEYRGDDEIQLVNDYNRVFIDAVRKTGGNNVKRFLIINPYAAEANERALSLFDIKRTPGESDQEYNDVKSRVIMSAHLYDNYYTEPGDKSSDNELSSYNKLTRIYNKAKLLNVPVIIGEFGSSLNEFKKKIMTKQGVDENTAKELAEVEVAKSNNFIVKTAKEFNDIEKGNNSNVAIKCIYYDHDTNVESFGLLDRNSLNWKHKIVLNGIMNGVLGYDYDYDYVNVDDAKNTENIIDKNVVEVENTLKNKKDFILILIVGVIIVSLGLYLIYISRKKNNNVIDK